MATASAVLVRPIEPDQASLWSDAWRRLRRNRLALVASVYLTFLVGVALLALVWTPYRMSAIGLAQIYSGPSPSHLLGADELGRDILSRLMVGAWPLGNPFTASTSCHCCGLMPTSLTCSSM